MGQYANYQHRHEQSLQDQHQAQSLPFQELSLKKFLHTAEDLQDSTENRFLQQKHSFSRQSSGNQKLCTSCKFSCILYESDV